jgi:hypothetical protein
MEYFKTRLIFTQERSTSVVGLLPHLENFTGLGRLFKKKHSIFFHHCEWRRKKVLYHLQLKSQRNMPNLPIYLEVRTHAQVWNFSWFFLIFSPCPSWGWIRTRKLRIKNWLFYLCAQIRQGSDSGMSEIAIWGKMNRMEWDRTEWWNWTLTVLGLQIPLITAHEW